MFVVDFLLFLDLTIYMQVTLEGYRWNDFLPQKGLAHDLHAGDIRRVMGEITSYHEKD